MTNAHQPREELPANPPPVSRTGKFPWKTTVVFVLRAVGIGVLAVKRKGEAAGSRKGGAGGRAAAGPVSVVVGTVASKDVPIYLDGLGTVQAFNTVTISSRVDGQLQKLGFREGQDVHAGDLLAQIDPEPFK